jgi:hypothetical protein
MENKDNSQNDLPSASEEWIKPQIKIISMKDSTHGSVSVGSDCFDSSGGCIE